MELKDNCLRKLLEECTIFGINPVGTQLSLLCCNVCKKIERHEELNKYEELYVFPLLLSYRKEESSFLRAFGSTMMEHTAEKFENTDIAQVHEFLSLLSRVSKGKYSYSCNDLLKMSEGSYCHVIARLYWSEKYDLMRIFAIQYIFNNSKISGSNVRDNWYHKDEKEPFFVIGVGLDEGITESITLNLLDGQEKFSDAYFFEMKFVDKLIDTFKFERKEFFGKAFQHDCLEFLNEATKKIDYCDFYDILTLSDQQKWKDVFSILKKYES
ncbi:MAG: hypothetical protein IJM37_04465 [Lachnospiraceae bacterium]|nr:hypothetical protein [Lachnospiraceae bacterium]